MVNIRWLSRFFIILCLIVGVTNIFIGSALIFYSYAINSQLSSNLQQINQSLGNSLAILSNVTILTSIAPSNLKMLSQNLSSEMDNISNNLYVIQRNFNQEANFFYNWSILGYHFQTTQKIGTTFNTLATQVGSINDNEIPKLLHLTNTETSAFSTPISNIAHQASSLNYTLSALAETYKMDIAQAQGVLPLIIIGLGIYTILQGILFVALGKVILYLTMEKSKARR